MLQFSKPTSETLTEYMIEKNQHGLTYENEGTTQNRVAPPGWFVNSRREAVGSGETAFLAAKEAFHRWEQLSALGWIAEQPPGTELEVGQPVVVAAPVFGLFWWANACRIIYIIDEEDGPMTRFGVGYGTLPDHAARGEELFLLEWDRTTDEVFYEIFSYSRPRALLARLFSPYLRYRQRLFARDSIAAIRRILNPIKEPAITES